MPLYPLLPLLFFGLCLYMLYSSVTVVGWGAFLGIGVLLVGALLLAGSSRLASTPRQALGQMND
ncbi:hypothetical protein I1A_002268 [Pseudomonas fluorescens R124]|uniref:Uncharacterized protein n=1 Tax=Pseudomonas fluorescens R124 TaxID=743713 RepID=A0A7U9CM99_PSEFL|nr:hypothetical protein I1A_002268 [Pseudomonas fluorescens R124]